MMQVAVITPYYRMREDWFATCIDSVRRQSYQCRHILVADGESCDMAEQSGLEHIVLPANHGDYGDSPRGIGSAAAFDSGCDAVAWLDADNWYAPDHIERLVRLQQETDVDICSSARILNRIDGTELGPCQQNDGKGFIDTNCYFVTRTAREVTTLWIEMAPELHPVGDRVLLLGIRSRGYRTAHSPVPTVHYRTSFPEDYRRFGETPPDGARARPEVARAIDMLNRRLRANPNRSESA